MIKELGGFLILLAFISLGFTTSPYREDTPIAYKRYIEVVTTFNEGPDLLRPFFFSMVSDLRLSEGGRTLLSGATFTEEEANEAHEEAISWALKQFAHLKIKIPESTDGLVLRYLEPTLRRNSPKRMDFIHSDPVSVRQKEVIDAVSLELIHVRPESEEKQDSQKKRRLE